MAKLWQKKGFGIKKRLAKTANLLISLVGRIGVEPMTY